MGSRFQGGRERQLVFLDRRLRELEAKSAAVAQGLIAATLVDRRTHRSVEVEREVDRLRWERERLEKEGDPDAASTSEEALERHLANVESQLREVLDERDRWFRESLDGRRRRQDDFRLLARLKEENERLTAELLRCASALCQNRKTTENSRLRRVWQMLRLSGS